ncbi:hypothetical protein EDC04DRAFT_3121972 [Pisolithus marmoratus]|nr:hypothetical protein EDC04DRAFT_3121972 [Pisolithus marmoratus]
MSLSHACFAAILYYDYLLTLRREVDFFWMKPRRSWMFVLFVANRYITLLSRVPAMVSTFWPRSWGEDGTLSATTHCKVLRTTNASYPSCKTVAVHDQVTVITVQIIAGIIMIIRVYALYMKSRRVLLFLVLVILAGIGVGCWAILSPSPSTARFVPISPLRNGCNVPTTYEQAERNAIAWSGQMAFDAIVFVLTLWRTLRVRRLGNRTLLDIFIRDGALYFGLMTGANVANITTLLVCNTSTTKSLFLGFTNTISSIMISRLMLNLRDPKILMFSQPMIPVPHHCKHDSIFELQAVEKEHEGNRYYIAEY